MAASPLFLLWCARPISYFFHLTFEAFDTYFAQLSGSCVCQTSMLRGSRLLSLRGVEYETASGEKIKASGREIRAQVEELAKCNGWKVQDLLTNAALVQGEPLACRLVEHVPSGWSLPDSSGYIMVRLPTACSVRGSSFGGGASEDKVPDFVPTHRRGKRAASHGDGRADMNETHTPPRRPQRQRTSYASYFQPSPPKNAQMGASQPLLERYHRLTFAASQPTKELKDGWILHACGNKKCAVISRFYIGDVPTNSLDTCYHRNMPQSSRTSLPKLQ